MRRNKNRKDLTGQRFGRLVALRIDYEKSTKHRQCFWLCRCDCGNITSPRYSALVGGRVMSCGCARNNGFKPSKQVAEEAPQAEVKPIDKSQWENEHADDWMFASLFEGISKAGF